MSEKIEFIPAKDLPVAEGDEVDVLCVENGELKRKEGASLGGGGAEWDAVIEIFGGTSIGNAENITLVSGSYDNVKTKMDAGEFPNMLIRWLFVYGNSFVTVTKPFSFWYNSGDTEMYYEPGVIVVSFDMPRYPDRYVYLHPDNSISGT